MSKTTRVIKISIDNKYGRSVGQVSLNRFTPMGSGPTHYIDISLWNKYQNQQDAFPTITLLVDTLTELFKNEPDKS